MNIAVQLSGERFPVADVSIAAFIDWLHGSESRKFRERFGFPE